MLHISALGDAKLFNANQKSNHEPSDLIETSQSKIPKKVTVPRAWEVQKVSFIEAKKWNCFIIPFIQSKFQTTALV